MRGDGDRDRSHCHVTSDPAGSPAAPQMFYLGEQVREQLADVLPPLGDVGVESVQVPAKAQRDHLEVVWAEAEQRQVRQNFRGT